MIQITVPAKWVLTGEHAVLRGARAIAVPDFGFSLTLQFTPSNTLPAQIVSDIPWVQRLIDRILSEAPQGQQAPAGRVVIQSDIPMGAGLGSSAAFCVALTELFGRLIGLSTSRYFDFARGLEDQFHGQSSGMDIAALLEQKPILFERGVKPVPLDRAKSEATFKRFRLHDTGLRSSTRDCIGQVNRMMEAHPERARALDQQMSRATELALAGIQEGLIEPIVQAMKLAQGSFREWGLVPESVADLEADLYRQGALAVKLTGAGGGGYLVALY